MFNKDIKFKYPWRPYQQKVLNQVEKYIEDNQEELEEYEKRCIEKIRRKKAENMV